MVEGGPRAPPVVEGGPREAARGSTDPPCASCSVVLPRISLPHTISHAQAGAYAFPPLPYFASCLQCIAHRVSHLCLCRIGFLSDLGFDCEDSSSKTSIDRSRLLYYLCYRNRGINHRSLHLSVYEVHLTHQFYNSGQAIEDWCSIYL